MHVFKIMNKNSDTLDEIYMPNPLWIYLWRKSLLNPIKLWAIVHALWFQIYPKFTLSNSIGPERLVLYAVVSGL
jgi:hypothetical protein